MQSLLALLLALPLWLACCQPVGMLSFWHVSGVWHVFCVLHLLEADGLSLKAAEVLCHFDICVFADAAPLPCVCFQNSIVF